MYNYRERTAGLVLTARRDPQDNLDHLVVTEIAESRELRVWQDLLVFQDASDLRDPQYENRTLLLKLLNIKLRCVHAYFWVRD